MNTFLENFDVDSWGSELSDTNQKRAVKALESGKVLYFPNLGFPLSLEENIFFSEEKIDRKSKNISYQISSDVLGGSLYEGKEALQLKAFLKRYANSTRNFLNRLIPGYQSFLIQAKTSFRPVEVAGRKSSVRKNDALLHVDAFPSSPNKGERILRVFTNVNPHGKPRVWRLGEPFEKVAETMLPKVSAPLFGSATFLKLLRITKDYRTAYDHYMLRMHDAMKEDEQYQKRAMQQEVHFPPGSSWIVFTDQVSHAATSGQYVLEQTFNLPVRGLANPETAPLRVLERKLNKVLV